MQLIIFEIYISKNTRLELRNYKPLKSMKKNVYVKFLNRQEKMAEILSWCFLSN